MRIAILFFTGTGNTEFAAREFQRAFGAEHPAELVNIELASTPSADWFTGYDLVGFGAPVYAYNEPTLFRRFLERLPRVSGQRAFLFMDAGQDVQAALERPARALKRAGFDLVLSTHLHLPGNVGVYRLEGDIEQYDYFGTHRRFEVSRLYDECRARVRECVSSLLAAERRCEPATPVQRLVTALVGLPFHGLAGPLMRWLLFADHRCDDCGTCVEVCPCGCITLDGRRPRFGSGCTVCVRCLNVCPRHAIRSRWPLRLLNREIQYLAPGWVPPRHARPNGRR